MQNKKFKIIQHTADVGLEVYGKNYKEIFLNAAFGLLKIICPVRKKAPPFMRGNKYFRRVKTQPEISNGVYQNKSITQKHRMKIIIEGLDYENLLVKWLNEIIYQIYVNKKIFSKFQIKQLNQKKLFAVAFYDFVHTITKEVKSATYHNLNIKKNNGLLKTKIIFDI